MSGTTVPSGFWFSGELRLRFWVSWFETHGFAILAVRILDLILRSIAIVLEG